MELYKPVSVRYNGLQGILVRFDTIGQAEKVEVFELFSKSSFLEGVKGKTISLQTTSLDRKTRPVDGCKSGTFCVGNYTK